MLLSLDEAGQVRCQPLVPLFLDDYWAFLKDGRCFRENGLKVLKSVSYISGRFYVFFNFILIPAEARGRLLRVLKVEVQSRRQGQLIHLRSEILKLLIDAVQPIVVLGVVDGRTRFRLVQFGRKNRFEPFLPNFQFGK